MSTRSSSAVTFERAEHNKVRTTYSRTQIEEAGAQGRAEHNTVRTKTAWCTGEWGGGSEGELARRTGTAGLETSRSMACAVLTSWKLSRRANTQALVWFGTAARLHWRDTSGPSVVGGGAHEPRS